MNNIPMSAAQIAPPSNVATNLDLLESCQNSTEKIIALLRERLNPVLSEDVPGPMTDNVMPSCICALSSQLQRRIEHTMRLNNGLENILSRLAV